MENLNKKFTTVIFDFDGTIMNTNDVIIESWQHAYKEIRGITKPVEEIVKSFGEPLLISMAREFPGVEPLEAATIYRKYQEEHASELVKLFSEMDTLVKEVKKNGYKTGIVTSRNYDSLMNYLKMFDLETYIDELVTCNDTEVHKPDPEPMNIALRKLGVAPEEAIMIGDSMFDILCAKNAGVKSVLVSWAVAVSQEDMVGPNRPDYFIEKPMDLFRII